jgi:phage gp29-like protein
MNRVVASRRIHNRRPAKGRSMLPEANEAWRRAREWQNPLRHFTLARAIQLAESYPRGEFADLMWTLGCPYNGIETADADLLAIIERRTASLREMDWNAQPKTGDRIDAALAQAQADAVHALIDGIGNLYEAIDHLALAFVRGFAHCEIIQGPGSSIVELRPVDQWHVVRRGIAGPWRYNPEARQSSWDSLPASNDMPEDRFIIREVKRPIGRIALLKWARQALNDADWGAYVERYGIASGVVTMPPDVGPEREAEFMAAAQAVAEAASGALPHGATWSPNSPDKGSGTSPFEDRLKWLSEKLVLAGTGGKLTMLTESGSGTLAGGAHADAFESLTRGDARAIGEVINRHLVEPWLRAQFPGQPVLAYFELAFREEVESSAVIEDAAMLATAGFRMAAKELSEKTGYELLPVATDPTAGSAGNGGANAMQTHATAFSAENGVDGAETGNPPLESQTGATVRNRESTPTKGADAPLADLLAGALRGSTDAWAAALIAAVADGAAEVPETTDETDDEEEDETDA